MSEITLEMIRHSAAHIMAAAVKQLYPDAKFDIGPATENGFYYDFDVEHPFNDEDKENTGRADGCDHDHGQGFHRRRKEEGS